MNLVIVSHSKEIIITGDSILLSSLVFFGWVGLIRGACLFKAGLFPTYRLGAYLKLDA